MNINNLTLGQIKEITASFNAKDSSKSLADDLIGQYVIIRSRNEGINSGYLVSATKDGCVIAEARRIWYHKPADKNVAWYEGVAISGVSEDSKLSVAVEKKVIVEEYSITVCSSRAEESLTTKTPHGQQ